MAKKASTTIASASAPTKRSFGANVTRRMVRALLMRSGVRRCSARVFKMAEAYVRCMIDIYARALIDAAKSEHVSADGSVAGVRPCTLQLRHFVGARKYEAARQLGVPAVAGTPKVLWQHAHRPRAAVAAAGQ